MVGMTSNAARIGIDERGIFLPARWWRGERFIPWLAVQTSEVDRNSERVCVTYADETGRVRSAAVGHRKVYRAAVSKHWREALVAELAARGELSAGDEGAVGQGSGGRSRAKTAGVLALAAGVFGVGLCAVLYGPVSEVWALCRGATPETVQSMKWLVYVMAVAFGTMPLVGPALVVMIWRNTRRPAGWRAWRIGRKGLFRREEDGHWEPVVLSAGDRITPTRVVVGGKAVPLDRLPRSVVLPHLLAILGRRRGVAPVADRAQDLLPALGIAFRLAVFWPLAILGICFLPAAFWGLPEMPDFSLTMLVGVTFGGCLVFAVGMLGMHLWMARSVAREFPDFLAETEGIRKRLGW